MGPPDRRDNSEARPPRLDAIFSSDIGHFDVIDMRHPLPEAYELVEDGHITADDFRAFTFANAVKLWGTQNPRFFEGTRVAGQAAAVLTAAQTPTLAAAEYPRRHSLGRSSAVSDGAVCFGGRSGAVRVDSA